MLDRGPEICPSLPQFLPSPGVFLPHTTADTRPPPQRASLTPIQNHSFKFRFKFHHLQEASSHWNITGINVESYSWTPDLRGDLGFTHLVRQSQSTFLESVFC